MSETEFESGFVLAGGLNSNYIQTSEQGLQLARVQKPAEDLVEEWQSSIYPFIGFFRDGGRLHLRTPQEQYEFGRKAAAEGLRVLAPDDIKRDTVYTPFLSNTDHLQTYLQEHPADQTRIIHQLFTDLRNAHAKGFIYGDRHSPNILVNMDTVLPEIVHIDFDMEISGPTAKELEVAEMTRTVVCAGESTVSPLSKWLGMQHAWFDLDVVSKYLSNHVAHWERDAFREAPGPIIEQLLTSAYAIKSGHALGARSLARAALQET